MKPPSCSSRVCSARHYRLAAGHRGDAARRARRTAAPASRGQAPATLGIGRPATPAEIAAWDIDVGPDGAGLPPGRGTSADGAPIYAARCAGCHGKTGKRRAERRARRPVAGRCVSVRARPATPKTIGSYWPYATTVFDYIRRAMPPDAPGSLKDDEVYALVPICSR